MVQSYRRPILFFAAIGLALFAVTGAQKALHYGIDPVMAAALGMVSGIGGGIMRDVLAGEVPIVLRADLYALAALAAASDAARRRRLCVAACDGNLPGMAGSRRPLAPGRQRVSFGIRANYRFNLPAPGSACALYRPTPIG